MGIYPDYKNKKGIMIRDLNNGVIVYKYIKENFLDNKDILNNEEIVKAQNIYNDLPNKEDIEIRVYVSVWTTYDTNSTPFYEWMPIDSFKELE